MNNTTKKFSITSIRSALTGGVTFIILITSGLVGVISIWGGLDSAIQLTRRSQIDKTGELSRKLSDFAESIEREVSTLAKVIGRSATQLEETEIIDILSAYSLHKSSLTSITLVRKNRSNIWVGRWEGEVIHEINTELDEKSYEIAVNGRPGDGEEGFEDIYIEPSEGRPVITYTKHIVDKQDNPIGTIYLDLGLKTLSSSLSNEKEISTQKTFVFDSNGAIIAHPSLSKIKRYKTFTDVPSVESMEDPIVLAIYKAVITEREDIRSMDIKGENWLISSVENDSFGESKWYSVSAIPRSEVLGPAITQSKFAGLISLVIMGFAVAYSQFIGRNITSSLEFLATTAGSIQELKLDIRLHKNSFLDELKVTEKAFESMIGALNIFAKYVPSGLVKKLIQLQSSGSRINAEEREVTILFTDIVSYTSISDGMSPTELATLLNQYFEILVSIVINNGGTVDKFIGDALMVFWNAPESQSDHPDRAIRCALEMQEEILKFNSERVLNQLPPLKTRVGIHTGMVLSGEIGSTERMNYTIVGDAVNTAARLESLGKEINQTLCVSNSTKEKCRELYNWINVGEIILRGRSKPTLVYTIEKA